MQGYLVNLSQNSKFVWNKINDRKLGGLNDELGRYIFYDRHNNFVFIDFCAYNLCISFYFNNNF